MPHGDEMRPYGATRYDRHDTDGYIKAGRAREDAEIAAHVQEQMDAAEYMATPCPAAGIYTCCFGAYCSVCEEVPDAWEGYESWLGLTAALLLEDDV